MTGWLGLVGPGAAALAVVAMSPIVRRRSVPPARALPRAAPPVVAPPPTGRSTRRFRRHGLVTAGLAVVGLLAGPLPAALLVAVGLLAQRLRPVLAARRRRAAIARELPDAVDLLVLGVHAGLSPARSVELLARSGPAATRPACAAVIHRLDRGTTFADALAELGERLGADARTVADVLATADRYGFPLAPVLDQLAAEARAARRRSAEAAARRLPVRLSFPLVVCTLPSFVLLAIAPAVVAALSSLGGASW